MRKCDDCKYAVFTDEGYSNWTVENTVFVCAKHVHPDGSFDRWYGENDKLNYAEMCPEFSYGESVVMDVEKENYRQLTDEQRRIYNMVYSSNGEY